MDVSEFKERLKASIGNVSRRDFARRANLTEGSIRSYLAGESVPMLDKLVNLASAAGVRPEWLAFGEGPMTVDEHAASGQPGQGYVLIPRLTPTGAAEKPFEGIAFQCQWLIGKGLAVNWAMLRAFEVQNPLMQPTIAEGDLILADTSQTEPSKWNWDEAVWLVILGGALMLKRLRRDQDGLWLLNDNFAYPPARVPDTDVQILGRVVWVGGRVGPMPRQMDQ